MRQTVPLCHLDDLADGSAKGFDPQHQGSDTVFIVRSGDKVFAYEDKCPHYRGQTSLPWRKDAYLDPFGETIVCAAHGAHFEIATGLCTAGPCLGESLTRVPLQIRDDGCVLAELNDNNVGGESP
ncbi:MAG: Rieske (2Fe-2S) protein [Gammaproteobacteria bacterium]|uniref:Rieske (2Fe-2S) protein n=1 Tax=Pseudomaricurvus alcaniphilus TaxID=1166482 RepID=UPI00140A8917|nr:Rieske (2Fe-2S) protein [Pseudomaricurvus alcaniphilus]MBR9911711.1 Rieske (2Fe-2S) protein [Gammaproteobacteria bacterium]NHN39142.1 Rieske (2Fe-2S) protein [Pseudomaricurvus alcaniphilus]